jgi:hypothetical protein
VADSNALRSRRKRQHAQGDHSLCTRRCRAERLKIAELPAGSGETLDAAAGMQDLAAQLAAAYASDPGNAALARELRLTLLSLSSRDGDAGRAAMEAFIADLGKPL